MYLIYSKKFITVFALFFHMWYLSKTVILVTMYLIVVMVAAKMSAVRN